ncbi:hypothetical protein CY35_01G116900 [Sphagnum magellanicum]|nr:hypothetical protein CY35_01G116900 [Sphagnum magellanicum]
MGGSKGKARKRREANYSAAHPGITPQLAPPPSAKDIVAIPSKLRRIMSLKAPSAPGHKEQQVGAANAAHNKQPKTPPNTKGGKQAPSAGKLDASKLAPPPTSDNKEPVVEEVGGKHSVLKISKRRRAEEELKALSEKFQATPIRKGIREKRKKYLEEKKKRKRLRGITYEPVPEREIIAFGDVVQGPPKLLFPPKAKITKEERPASHERIRSQVIEAYRQRRAGASRLIKGSVVMVDGPKVEDS